MTNKPTFSQIQVTQDDVLGLVQDLVSSFENTTEFILLMWSDITVTPGLISRITKTFNDEKISILGIKQTPYVSSDIPDMNFTNSYCVPTTKSSVVFIRRSLLDEFFTDLREEFGECVSLDDISVFLNQFGYNTVEIFVSDKLFPETSFERIVTSRSSTTWEGYVRHVEHSLSYSSDSFISVFSGFVLPNDRNLLIDATGLPTKLNGTSRVALSVLQELEIQILNKNDFASATVIVPEVLVQGLSIKFPHLKVQAKFPNTEEKFGMGFSLTPVNSLQQCFDMSVRCLRWVVLQLDLIAIRSYPHLSQQMSSIEALRFVHKYADSIIYISSFSAHDAQQLLKENVISEQEVCLLGLPDSFNKISEPIQSARISQDSVFILGNDDPHKQVQRITRSLLQVGARVTSITSKTLLGGKHHTYAPGALSDSEISKLLQSSAVIVFPSLYEGFGLPVVEAALFGRPVLVWDTEVNRELVDQFNLTNVFLCSSTKDLVEKYQLLRANEIDPQSIKRTMSDFNDELVRKLADKLAVTVNTELVSRRWAASSLIGSAFEETQRKNSQLALANTPRSNFKLFIWKFGHWLNSFASN